MKNSFFFLFISAVIFACSSIPKKNKKDYYIPRIETKRVKDIDGQLSILKCDKEFNNTYKVKFNKNKDSLLINSTINFCELFKEDLSKEKYVNFLIGFYLEENKKLKYRYYEYGVFNKKKELLYKKSGGGLYCFIQDYEAFKKTKHYILKDTELTVLESSINLDSVSGIIIPYKIIKD